MPVALVAAKPLGVAEVLALVLTLAVSLTVTQDTETHLGVCTVGESEGKSSKKRSIARKQSMVLQICTTEGCKPGSAGLLSKLRRQ